MSEKTDLNISHTTMTTIQVKTITKFYLEQETSSTRELTQSQSILQDQVAKFGDHMFKEVRLSTVQKQTSIWKSNM